MWRLESGVCVCVVSPDRDTESETPRWSLGGCEFRIPNYVKKVDRRAYRYPYAQRERLASQETQERRRSRCGTHATQTRQDLRHTPRAATDDNVNERIHVPPPRPPCARPFAATEARAHEGSGTVRLGWSGHDRYRLPSQDQLWSRPWSWSR